MHSNITEDIHLSGAKDTYLSTESASVFSTTNAPSRIISFTTNRSTFDKIQSTTEQSPFSEDSSLLNADNPLGIKIKEITKPEEIRITDDKPKPFKPPVRTSTTSASEATPSFDFVLHDVGSTPIEEEGLTSSGDAPSEILPEEPEITQHDHSDDLTPLDSPDERFSKEEFGVKNVRQTGTISEPLLSSEIVISDKLLAISTSTDGSGDLQFASSTQSSFDSSEATRSSTEDDQSSRIVIVDGQEFKVKAADGLQRGVDDEDDRKASRKSNPQLMDKSMLTTIAPDELVSSTSESTQTTSSGLSSKAFDTIYYEPATEEPLSYVSKEAFSFDDMKTSRPLTSSEIISIYEQESMLKQGTVGPMLTSDEIIAQYEEAMLKYSTVGPLDKSEATLVIRSQDQFTEDPDFEDSSLSQSAFSSSTFSVAEFASSTTETILEESSRAAEQSHHEEEVLDDRDKNPEFPEQPDDYSLHSQMQEEDAKSRGLPRDNHGDEKLSAALTELEITSEHPSHKMEVSSEPIESSGEVLDGSSESSRQLHIFNVGQERSPGEPHLIPEWERNTSTVAPAIIKFDRRDSLILLPVKALEDKTHGPIGTVESSTGAELPAPSTSGPPSSASSSEDLIEEGSTTEHNFINEVSSVESRSNGDEFDFGEEVLGTRKLNKFLRMPGDILRYRKRMITS